MPRKRRTKKQIAAAEAARVRMQKYWAEKKAENADQGKWDAWVIDTANEVEKLLEKVYMAGWHRVKKPHPSIANQMGIADAKEKVKEVLNTWKI